MLTRKLLNRYGEKLKRYRIEDVIIGLGYTAVQLDSGNTGLAATLRYDLPRGCSLLKKAGKYTGINGFEGGRLLQQPDPLVSGIGLATINSVINQSVTSNTSDILDSLEIDKTDRVGMVGYFGPLIGPVRDRAKELCVFEREPTSEEDTYPDWAVSQLLPDCDVAIISSTTIINNTIDHLLELSPERTALLGPSTPLAPLLFQGGITHLFGSIVTKPENIKEIIMITDKN